MRSGENGSRSSGGITICATSDFSELPDGMQEYMEDYIPQFVPAHLRHHIDYFFDVYDAGEKRMET
jgi:hypothetical protein